MSWFFENTSCGLPEIPSLSYTFVSSCYSSSSIPYFNSFADIGALLIPDIVPPPPRLHLTAEVSRLPECALPTFSVTETSSSCPQNTINQHISLGIPDLCAPLTLDAKHTVGKPLALTLVKTTDCEDDNPGCGYSASLDLPCPSVSFSTTDDFWHVSQTAAENCTPTVSISLQPPKITASVTSEVGSVPYIGVTTTEAEDGWGAHFDFLIRMPVGETSVGVNPAEIADDYPCSASISSSNKMLERTDCEQGLTAGFELQFYGDTGPTWPARYDMPNKSWDVSDIPFSCESLSVSTFSGRLVVNSCNFGGVVLTIPTIGTWTNALGMLEPDYGVLLQLNTITAQYCDIPCTVKLCPTNAGAEELRSSSSEISSEAWWLSSSGWWWWFSSSSYWWWSSSSFNWWEYFSSSNSSYDDWLRQSSSSSYDNWLESSSSSSAAYLESSSSSSYASSSSSSSNPGPIGCTCATRPDIPQFSLWAGFEFYPWTGFYVLNTKTGPCKWRGVNENGEFAELSYADGKWTLLFAFSYSDLRYEFEGGECHGNFVMAKQVGWDDFDAEIVVEWH